jgi:hypothetical protein
VGRKQERRRNRSSIPPGRAPCVGGARKRIKRSGAWSIAGLVYDRFADLLYAWNRRKEHGGTPRGCFPMIVWVKGFPYWEILMKRKDAAAYASNASLLKSIARLPKIERGSMHDKSMRKFSHKGHEISIATIYQIKIDGRMVHLPLQVAQDGHVHSHAIPNYSESSAVDIVRKIIDLFPEDFEKKRGRRPAGGQHGSHSHGHHR